MEVKVGKIIVLKDYTGREKYKKDAGIITAIAEDKVLINWIEKEYDDEVNIDNILEVKLHCISTYAEKLKVGDLVVTNGDGSRVYTSWFVGKVGEISGQRFFLWNNKRSGSDGTIEVTGYKYNWAIKLTNSRAKIGILNKHKKLKETEDYCFNCENVFLKTDMKEGLDGNNYCKKCYDKIHFKCADDDCEKIITKNTGQKGEDDKYYCNECWNEKFYTCNDCDAVIWQEDSCYSDITNRYYCNECYGERFVNCNHCDEELERENSHRDPDGNALCNDCYGERCTTCRNCGEAVWTDDSMWDEDVDESYCPDCWNHRRPNLIHDYGYHPDIILKKEKWEDELYLGIELEVNHDEFGEKSNKFLEFLETEKIKERFYLKHDSSIGAGFEIVSHPSTLMYYHRNVKLQKILKWLKKEDFEAEESGKCGIHIHISRNYFSNLDITKLRLFFKKNEEQLKIFSNRENGHDDDYHFCKFETKTEKQIIREEVQNDRYWALNLNSSRETIELRLFKATLDYKRFLAIMQFSEAISRFVKYVGITSFLYGESKYRGNSWLLFIDWAKKENKYKDMINHFVEIKLCDKEKLKCV